MERWNSQVYQEACEWFVEFRVSEPDAVARQAFYAWLRESPAHMGAYLDVSANWTRAAAVDTGARWSKEQLIEAAKRETADVVTAFADGAATVPTVTAKPYLRWLPQAAVIAAVALIACAGWLMRDPRYSTGIGEQRSLALSDGSTVQLDSLSRIRIRYSEHERSIELLKGQALFEVAKDSTRPFMVHSGKTTVRALGTQFDVRRKDAGETTTVVTVVEGVVAVAGGNGSTVTDTKLLTAGEQVTVSPRAAHKNQHPNLAAATAWTQRQLVFDATPLSEVAEEFNRYNERQLRISDASLGGFQIDGVFSSTDAASLIRFLRERPEMQVSETGASIVVTRRPVTGNE